MRSGRYESSENSNLGTAITFFLIGVGAGAVAGLLLAPKTGKQMRRELQRGYDHAREAFDDWSEDARGRMREGVRDASDAVRDVAARGIDLAADLAEDFRDNVEPLRKAVKRS